MDEEIGRKTLLISAAFAECIGIAFPCWREGRESSPPLLSRKIGWFVMTESALGEKLT